MGLSIDSSLYYNISKTEKQEKTEKFYAAFIKLSNSFLILSGVAFLPIITATSLQVISSKILYLIIRCILCGIVFIHFSTCILISSAFCSEFGKHNQVSQ